MSESPDITFRAVSDGPDQAIEFKGISVDGIQWLIENYGSSIVLCTREEGFRLTVQATKDNLLIA